MKLLRVTAEGLPLIKGELDLIFYAQQRVSEDDRNELQPLFSNIYLNPTTGFIGINASGKTTILHCICLALDIVNSNPINYCTSKIVLGDSKKAVFNIVFSTTDDEICKLETVISADISEINEKRYKIISERLWVKTYDSVSSRKTLTDYEGIKPAYIRTTDEDFLSDDVSITIAFNRKNQEQLQVANLLKFTDVNYLPYKGEVSKEIIEFLDPTIERLNITRDDQNNDTICLKFKEREEYIIHNFLDLNSYLSSGTIKGIVTFTLAWNIFHSGGILIVDELENHFNKEIVATLMRLFMDSEFNKKASMLIFSTHYPELLDEYNRNDSIYITKNIGGITAENLSKILSRNDIKKSDAYQSGVMSGTTPSYEAYIKLKKSFEASLK